MYCSPPSQRFWTIPQGASFSKEIGAHFDLLVSLLYSGLSSCKCLNIVLCNVGYFINEIMWFSGASRARVWVDWFLSLVLRRASKMCYSQKTAIWVERGIKQILQLVNQVSAFWLTSWLTFYITIYTPVNRPILITSCPPPLPPWGSNCCCKFRMGRFVLYMYALCALPACFTIFLSWLWSVVFGILVDRVPGRRFISCFVIRFCHSTLVWLPRHGAIP